MRLKEGEQFEDANFWMRPKPLPLLVDETIADWNCSMENETETLADWNCSIENKIKTIADVIENEIFFEENDKRTREFFFPSPTWSTLFFAHRQNKAGHRLNHLGAHSGKLLPIQACLDVSWLAYFGYLIRHFTNSSWAFWSARTGWLDWALGQPCSFSSKFTHASSSLFYPHACDEPPFSSFFFHPTKKT